MKILPQLRLQNYFRGDNIELWQDSYSESPNKLCSRVWRGKAPDVAEVNLDDASSQEEAISLIGMIPWILVRCSDWKMIPLENLVSVSRGSGTKISVAIDKIVDLNGAAFALEHGVDALLLPANDNDLWDAAVQIVSSKISTNEYPDGLDVYGGSIKGARINSFDDHRIAMTALIASLVSDGDILVENCKNIDTSFPAFIEIANSIGMDINND